MALFRTKTEDSKKEVAAPKAVAPKKAAGSFASYDHSAVLIGPRVTEKAAMGAEKNVYAFNVAVKASKGEIVKAIKSYYKVSPTKIRIVRVPGKKVMVRGKVGVKAGGKKAYVFLKKGEKIETI